MKKRLFAFLFVFPILACSPGNQVNTFAQRAYWACQTATPVPTQQFFIGTRPAPTPETTLTPTVPGEPIYGRTTPVPTETPYYRVGVFYLNQWAYMNGISVSLEAHTQKQLPAEPDATYHFFHFALINQLDQPQIAPLSDLVFIRIVADKRGRWGYSEHANIVGGYPSAAAASAEPLEPGKPRQIVVGVKAPAGPVTEVGLVTDWTRPIEGGLPVWFLLGHDEIACRDSAMEPPPPTPALLKDIYGFAPVGNGSAVWPANGGAVTSLFGCRDSVTGIVSPQCPAGQEFHNGTDIAVPNGSEVKAPVSGIVTFAGPATAGADCSDLDGSNPPHKGYGNYIKIQSSDGQTHILAHLKTIEAQPGALVSAGQRIGTADSTGCSSGPHIHWSCFKGALPVDPESC